VEEGKTMSQELVILSKLYAIEQLLEELVPEAKRFLEENSKFELERLKTQEEVKQKKMLYWLEKRLGVSNNCRKETKQEFDFVSYSAHHTHHNDDT
jgi:hypothetical protein